jgi:hypothetical protein
MFQTETTGLPPRPPEWVGRGYGNFDQVVSDGKPGLRQRFYRLNSEMARDRGLANHAEIADATVVGVAGDAEGELVKAIMIWRGSSFDP